MPLESKRSISEIYNPEDSVMVPDTYEWKNIKISRFSRIGEFNNKNLRDEDMIREVPLLHCFRNLKEF